MIGSCLCGNLYGEEDSGYDHRPAFPKYFSQVNGSRG